MTPRLKEQYLQDVKPKLIQQFGVKNAMAAPRLEKIVVNMGCKGAVENKGRIDAAMRDLSTITGQKSDRAQGAQVDRRLQAARGHADRRRGDACAATACGSSPTA